MDRVQVKDGSTTWVRRRRVGGGILGIVTSLVLIGSNASAATPGWLGEVKLSNPATGDGWEPAIAADPSAPYVYAGWMQWAANKLNIAVRVSADGGSTWGTVHNIKTSNQGQYDIVLATTSTGALYATYMQSNHVVFTKSTDHGATFVTPIQVSGGTWADKPWMASSANGNDVYIAWTTRGDLYAVNSHNGGATWSSPLRLTSETGMYYFSNGGTVLPNGDGRRSSARSTRSPATSPASRARSRSRCSGRRTAGRRGRAACPTRCSPASPIPPRPSRRSRPTRAARLVLVYSGSLAVGANGHVYIRRSTDSGATWGARTELTTSAGGADATSVAAAGKAAGQFTVTWMDARGGGWNVWQRGSTDGGLTWSADAKVSDATTGAPYKTAAGFGLPYGDYDMVAINSAGKTVAVMGEGDTTQTHGDIWVNRVT